jgi:flagellin-like hook-associated protein FlgL
MSLVIATNTSAQFAQDALRANQHKTATAMQRLATGLRINSARDDAAGLAIGQSMTSQIRGLNQAVRNINDGINLLQTAEGGLGSITDMLQRMRELAVQSANGTNSSSQRVYLQKEAAALQEQIGKVVDTTIWNDKKLLDGSFTGQKIQVGANEGVNLDVSIASVPQINGNLIVASTTPTPPVLAPVIHSTAMDGSIYMVGRTTMSNLEGQTNAGGRDAFITKYAPDGTIAWTKMIGTTGDETARAVTTGTDGMIYVTGSTTGNLDGQLNTGTRSDGFISKFNSDGTKLWTREFGAMGSLEDEGRAIATGPDGGIYVTGYTNSNYLQGIYTTDLVTYSPSHNPTTDAFLTKYSADGSVLWTQLLTSVNFDVGNSITVGTDGSVFLAGITAGNLNGQINGGGGGGSGIGDGFVTKYSADGTKLWTKLTGTSAWEASNAIKVGTDGSIFVAGSESNGGSVTDGSFTKYLPDGTKA